jgi:hypothetical protein
LSTCKEQILYLLGSAYQGSQDNSFTQESLGELKDLISGIKEDLDDQLDQVQQSIKTVDSSLREILQEDQARLQSSISSITRAQQVADAIKPQIIIERNEAGKGSRAIFGTDTSQPQFNLTVANNKAGLGAVVSAGVHSPQTLQALLANSRSPDLALALQALQTQSRSANTEGLQSVLNHLATEHHQGLTDVPQPTIPSIGPLHVNTPEAIQAPRPSTESIHKVRDQPDN